MSTTVEYESGLSSPHWLRAPAFRETFGMMVRKLVASRNVLGSFVDNAHGIDD